MPQATMRSAIVEVVHVTIACERPFEVVRDALGKDVPALDPRLIEILIGANAAEIEERRAAGPKLWLFETRDHGAPRRRGRAIRRRRIQFEIGNPLTAERMTRHRLAAVYTHRCVSFSTKTSRDARSLNTICRPPCSSNLETSG